MLRPFALTKGQCCTACKPSLLRERRVSAQGAVVRVGAWARDRRAGSGSRVGLGMPVSASLRLREGVGSDLKV